MSTTAPQPPRQPGVSAGLAILLTTVLFLALAILGLGVVSFVTETDILQIPGGDQAPGIVGMVCALAAYVLALRPAVRVARPRYPASVPTAVITALVHLIAVFLCALPSGLGAATGAVAHLVVGGPSGVIAVAAFVSAWIAVALRRTRLRDPRWPWEGSE